MKRQYGDQLLCELNYTDQAPRQYMYNVMVANKALAVFDTADEALRFAMHNIFIGTNDLEHARHAIENGHDWRYAYGFSDLHIVPVAKRKD